MPHTLLRPAAPSTVARARRRLSGAVLAGLLAVTCGRSAESPVLLDLVAGFARAETRLEPRRIDFGEPTARSHLGSGWSVDEHWSGLTSFVWGLGPSSTVSFFLATPRPLTMSFRCQALDIGGPAAQAITLVLNGRALATVPVRSALFATYQMRIPAAAQRRGDNQLSLRYTRWGVPGQPGGETRPLAVAWDWLAFGGTHPVAPMRLGESLFIPLNARLDFVLDAPVGSRLVVAGIEAHPAALEEPVLEIAVSHDGRRERPHRLRAGAGDAAVELGSDRPGLVRVSLTALAASTAGPAAGLEVLRPRVLGGSAVPASRDRAARTTHPGAPARRPNILVYLVDTLRADRLGAYGYPRAVSPHIDALAAEGVLFRHAYAPSSWTKTSVASFLTGTSPFDHRVLDRDDALPATAGTLAERLTQAGWQTVAVSASDVVSAPFGFDRGFERFVQLSADAPGADAARVVAELRRWLDRHRDTRPFFAYVHTMDPHDPYAPPEPYRSRFAPLRRTSLERVDRDLLAAALAADPGLTKEQVSRDMSALYDGEIAYNDAQLGTLLAELRRRRLYDDTLIVVLSDHGEEFLDHGQFGHGHTLYRELLRVPLILKLPGRATRKTVVDQPVQLVDFLPSLLGWLGIEAENPGGPDLLAATGNGDRPLLSLLRLDGVAMASVIYDHRHLISATLDEPRRDHRLFDIDRDPHEQADRATADPLTAGLLLGLLREQLARLEEQPAAPTVVIDDELDARLRALGYGG